MPDRMTPAELITALRELARAGYMDTWPIIPAENVIESEAADWIESAVKVLEVVALGTDKQAIIAQALLSRLAI